MRVVEQYDYKKAWFRFVPTIEVSTTKAVSGSLYSELGSGNTFAIVGVSRTNLKPPLRSLLGSQRGRSHHLGHGGDLEIIVLGWGHGRVRHRCCAALYLGIYMYEI